MATGGAPSAARRAADLRLRAGVLVLCLVPGVHLAARAAAGDLGANPIERVTLDTGWWALVLLLATLAVTPLRRLTGWNRLAPHRRTLGLAAFGYATSHVVIFVALDHGFRVGELVEDVAGRPFIAAGAAAFLLLVPLAATSTRGWIRRLGRNWTWLHRLSYLAAALAVLHFYWKRTAKLDLAEPLIAAAVLVLLLGARLAWRAARQRRGAGSRREAGGAAALRTGRQPPPAGGPS
jgi:methionine sulfoxide reductase heme-binding subunit